MNSETQGAISLAVRHLNKVSWNSRNSKKYLTKAQKQLTRAKKYSGIDFHLKKDRFRWIVSVDGLRP